MSPQESGSEHPTLQEWSFADKAHLGFWSTAWAAVLIVGTCVPLKLDSFPGVATAGFALLSLYKVAGSLPSSP